MFSIAWREDFFTVLPSGFYVLLALSTSIPLNTIYVNLLTANTPLNINILSNVWYIGIFILFCSYVLGSILTAFPCNWTQYFIAVIIAVILSLCKLSLKRYDSKSLGFCKIIKDHAQFPHYETLKKYIDAMGTNNTTKKGFNENVLCDGVPIEVFNLWKNNLNYDKPEIFKYYQTFEAQSRFFAAMLWACLTGASIWFVLPYYYGLRAQTIYIPQLTMIEVIRLLPYINAKTLAPLYSTFMSVSFVFAFLFGVSFWRVRRNEATVLLSLYLVYCNKHRQTFPNGWPAFVPKQWMALKCVCGPRPTVKGVQGHHQGSTRM